MLGPSPGTLPMGMGGYGGAPMMHA